LFASNASGKSSILSALSYCLFDKCDRTFKASNILNTQKMSFNCKFNFEIENVDYFIERKGQQDKKGNVKVIVKFYKINPETKEEIDLNGEARRDTNDVIRDYIGTYDDFLLTVLSIQNNSEGNFIDMGQADRKDLIAKFMGITIYDQLDTIAKSESKEIIALLKNYSKTDYPKLLELKIQESELLRKNIENEKIELEKTENKLKNENTVLSNHSEKIINIGNAPTNIVELESNKEKYLKEKNEVNSNNKLVLDTLNLLRENLDSAKQEFNNIDAKKLQEDINVFNTLILQKTNVENSISKIEIELKSKQQTKEKLGIHKYDPNCKYCAESNKKHFDHTSQLNEEIKNIENNIHELKTKHTSMVEETKRYDPIIKLKNRFSELESIIQSLEFKLNKSIQDNLRYVNRLLQLDQLIETTLTNIELYNKEKDAIESNKIIFDKIRQIKQNISSLETFVRSQNQKISELSGKLAVTIEQKTQYEEQIKMAKIWELQQQAYTYYLMAISRDGIPYDLISKALPTIESEINNILHQIVDFTVNLFTDGKNVIGYINYDGKKWPIEMGSGLERFALSLAIRVALTPVALL
jgi:DNA repair exonuclease SbcCD ATPase subunit